MDTLLRLLLLTTLIAVLAACGSATPTTAPATDASTAPAAEGAAAATATRQPTATVAPTATPEPVEPGTSRSAPLPLSTELRFKDWAVVITDVARGAAAAEAIAGANQFNDPPPEGWQYLLATLRMTNISTEQEAQSVLFGIDLRVTGDRNVLYSQASGSYRNPWRANCSPRARPRARWHSWCPPTSTA